MGSYGVIKEALLVKYNTTTHEHDVVQKLVPATVNGLVITVKDGGFKLENRAISAYGIYHGGAFGFSDAKIGNITASVNIPGYGVKNFFGSSRIIDVSGVGQGVLIEQYNSEPKAPYTHLCLVVESPGSVFAEN